jgi:hypothetical protein
MKKVCSLLVLITYVYHNAQLKKRKVTTECETNGSYNFTPMLHHALPHAHVETAYCRTRVKVAECMKNTGGVRELLSCTTETSSGRDTGRCHAEINITARQDTKTSVNGLNTWAHFEGHQYHQTLKLSSSSDTNTQKLFEGRDIYRQFFLTAGPATLAVSRKPWFIGRWP